MEAKVNPRTLRQDAVPAPLMAYVDDSGIPIREGYWGWFGWEGACMDTAINLDAPHAIQFCHDHGMIDKTTKTLAGKTLREHCLSLADFPDGMGGLVKRQRAPQCAKALAKLGYPK